MTTRKSFRSTPVSPLARKARAAAWRSENFVPPSPNIYIVYKHMFVMSTRIYRISVHPQQGKAVPLPSPSRHVQCHTAPTWPPRRAPPPSSQPVTPRVMPRTPQGPPHPPQLPLPSPDPTCLVTPRPSSHHATPNPLL